MKKILLTLGVLFCLWKLHAQPISVPGSSFPVISTPSNNWRFIGLTTNGDSGGSSSNTRSNWTMTWGSMVSDLSAIINPTFPWLIVTNGSPTSVIQAQMNSLTNGGVLAVQPGTYTITATLQITNPMVIFGDGATFAYGAGITNFMMDTGTNYLKSLTIDNLRFDGGAYATYSASNYFHIENRGAGVDDANPYFNPLWLNRTGLRADVSGGVTITHCYFYGWAGNGALFLSAVKGLEYFKPKLLFVQNHCYTNFISVILACTAEDTLGYYNNGAAGQSAWSCEYALIAQNDINTSYTGVSAAPGNAKVENNYLTGNWIALLQTSDDGNATHGSYCNNTMNHNTFAIWSWWNRGGLFSGNVFLRNGQDYAPGQTNIIFPYGGASGIHFDKVTHFQFVGNKLSREYLTFTNGCTGIFANNTYGSLENRTFDTNLIWGVDIPTNFDANIVIRDNWETCGNLSDNSVNYISSLTNAWPPTFFSLRAKSTNEAWQLPSNSVPPHWWFGHFDASSNVVFDGHMP